MSNQPLAAERAQYAIALQDAYIRLAAKRDDEVRGGNLPAGLKIADLNILEPTNKLLHAPFVLVSFGQYQGTASKAPGIVGARKDCQSIVIGDSGGYQFIRQRFLGDQSRVESLRWLEENAQVAMTLDIPTHAIKSNPQFPTFESCLEVTLENLDFIQQNHARRTSFLNVLQGRDRNEITRWYEAVKDRPFNGWAFGGRTRDIPELVRLVAVMLRDGLLGPNQAHIHVLGVSTPTMAVLLNAVQAGIRRQLGLPQFRVTFDTSSPSQMMQRGAAYVGLVADGRRLSMASRRWPDSYAYRGNSNPFPFVESAVMRTLTLGDLCFAPGSGKAGAWDALSNAIVVNHNLERMLVAFEEANRIADLVPATKIDAGRGFQGDYLPPNLVNVLAAIRRIFDAVDPLSQLQREGGALKGALSSDADDCAMEDR